MRTAPTPLAGLCTVCALLACPAPGTAQSDVSMEVGYSQAGAPLGLESEPGRFLVGGIRASANRSGGTGIGISVLAGRTLDDANGGDFLSASVAGTWLTDLEEGWSFGFDARGFGFRVETPFVYEALGAEGGPLLRYQGDRSLLRIAATGGVGSSLVELRAPRTDRVRVIEDELWRYGGTAEWLWGSPSVMVGAAAGGHRSAGGDYASAGVRLLTALGPLVAEARVDRWSTPDGPRTTGGLSFVLPVARHGWGVRSFLGRSEPDPLTLSQPGGTGVGLLAGRSLYRSKTGGGTTLFRVVERASDFASVEMRVEAVDGVAAMSVLGDFTLWDEIPMRLEDGEWIVRVQVPVGTHHFGFLADGDWYLPADAPDRVPDEWGRESATLIIEP